MFGFFSKFGFDISPTYLLQAASLPNTPAQNLPLEDIITPDTVSAWPPALGWWIVLLLVMGLFIFTFFYYQRYQQKWGYRKEALRLLDNIMDEWKTKKLSNEIVTQELLALLKRTAITAYPTNKIEKAYGEQWLNILKTQAPSLAMDKSIDELILSSQYQKDDRIKPQILVQFCQNWIRQHQGNWQGVNA